MKFVDAKKLKKGDNIYLKATGEPLNVIEIFNIGNSIRILCKTNDNKTKGYYHLEVAKKRKY